MTFYLKFFEEKALNFFQFQTQYLLHFKFVLSDVKTYG